MCRFFVSLHYKQREAIKIDHCEFVNVKFIEEKSIQFD